MDKWILFIVVKKKSNQGRICPGARMGAINHQKFAVNK